MGARVSIVTVTESIAVQPFARSITESVYVPACVVEGVCDAGSDNPPGGDHEYR